ESLAQGCIDQNPGASRLAAAEGLISGCSVPLISKGKTLGVLSIGSFREAAFMDDDVELLCQIAAQVAISVENALAYEQIEELKNTLAKKSCISKMRSEANILMKSLARVSHCRGYWSSFKRSPIQMQQF